MSDIGKDKAKRYEDLGRQLEALYDSLNPNRKTVYRVNFIKGVWSGLGGVVGATVGIALLLWLLSLFGQIPLIGHFVDTVKHTLQNRT
jgi:Domain of unknown function (DUF5665)